MFTNPSPTALASRRDRVVITFCVVALTLLAWAYLFRLERDMAPMIEHDQMMAAMGMSMDMSWTLRDVLYAFMMWSVMMVGMMAPSAAPVVALYAGAQRTRGLHGTGPILSFGAAYLLVWVAFSAVAALSQWALHEAAMLRPAMAIASERAGGAILIAAGIYQWTPIKGACLTHCQTPLGFLMSHWREGPVGALGMGLKHGAYCLGCCWALMLVLFVVGVMNLAWVAALTVFVLVEKIGPAGTMVARVAGTVLIAAGMMTWLV